LKPNLQGPGPNVDEHKEAFLHIVNENRLLDEDILLSSIEPKFFCDEKTVEMIVKGTVNTIPLGDLMG